MAVSSKKWIVANWKMHGRSQFVRRWSDEFFQNADDAQIGSDATVEVVVAPPFPYIQNFVERAIPVGLAVGAQDLSQFGDDGAQTGEVNGDMLVDIGCKYVIIGHSERRAMGETEQVLRHKLAHAQAAGLTPIFCIGESLETRQAGRAQDFVLEQLQILCGYPSEKPLIVAYEPVWAIGTGATATIEDVNAMHATISRFNRPILYGGSVKPDNAQKLLQCEHVHGALVGGASLKPADFLAIVEAAA